MTALELLRWGDLEARRRRVERRGLGRLPPLVWSGLFAAALVAEVARRGWIPGAGLVAIVILVTHTGLFFLAPFRTFWRHDSKFLARLPLDGDALYRLSFLRALRATGLITLPCLIASGAVALFGAFELGARLAVVCGVAALGAGVLAPAVTLLAGAAVANEKAQSIINSFGGEFQAPKNTMLGALPGFGATFVVVCLYAGRSWVLGGNPETGVWMIAVGCAVPLLAGSWAFLRARAVMPAALREVAALDQERLAHVDLVTPSALERLFARFFSAPIQNVVVKDISLLRRRFPLGYFLFALCIGTLWLVAWLGEPLESPWLFGATLLFCAHTAVMAYRSVSPPTEEIVLLRSLPVVRRDWVAVKRGYGWYRLWVFLVAGATPLLWVEAFAPTLLWFFAAVGVVGTIAIHVAVSDNQGALR